MITAHFDKIVRQLRNHSASLKMENIFVDKLWTIIDDDQEIQRLLFKQDRSLIMTKNGQVKHGTWDYLPEARSIVINRKSDSILCNEAYIDEGVMILRLDGTDNQFFTLANANVIPDLDITKYLKTKRHEKLGIAVLKLVDGKLLEINYNEMLDTYIGRSVSIDMEDVKDGIYEIAGGNKFYEITESKIIQIRTAVVYNNPEGIQFTVNQKNNDTISIGDTVFINKGLVENQSIKFSKRKILVISDGKVIRFGFEDSLAGKVASFFDNGIIIMIIVFFLVFIVSLLLIISMK